IANGGTLTLNDSTVSGNHLYSGGFGSGIFNGGTLTLNSSTISGNSGGSCIFNYRTLMVNNSTISGNKNLGGAGLSNVSSSWGDAPVVLVNSTVADNTGSQISSRRESGTGQATVRFRNTLVSGNGVRPNFVAGVGGTFVSEGHNLSNDDSG